MLTYTNLHTNIDRFGIICITQYAEINRILLIQIDNNPIRTERLEKFFVKKTRQADFHFQVFALLLIMKILFPMTTQKRNCSSVQTSFQFFHGELSFIYTFNNHTQRKKINWSVTELSNKRSTTFLLEYIFLLFYNYMTR